MKAMKTLVFAICFFSASAALAQANGTVLTNDVQPFRISDHVNRASQQPISLEQNLLGQNSITSGQGERPISDFFVDKAVEPLGDAARRLKEEHMTAKKSAVVVEKQ